MKSCLSKLRNLCKIFSLIFPAITILYLIYIVILVKVILPMQTSNLALLNPTPLEENDCEGNVINDTIIKLNNSRTYLIAAYLDLRIVSRVRILGITYRYVEELLYCNFCFYDTNDTVLVEVDVHTDHFNFPYGTTDFLCPLRDKRIPEYVSIHQEGNDLPSVPILLKIQNIQPQKNNPSLQFEYDFLICISALFGSYDNVLQFIQAMEMYQLLGAQKVIIYHTDSSPVMKEVLSYYLNTDFLDLIPWPITSFINVSTGWHYPEHPGDLHYYGQTAALNDCLYRHMYKSKFIALHDIDEIILPTIHKDWTEMLDYLENTSPTARAFLFQNHVFPTTFKDKANSMTPETWLSVPGLNILQHVYREPNLPNELNPTKMIINPRNVIRTSVHVPLDLIGTEFCVPEDIAKLCHYREPKQKGLEKEFLIKDTIMSRYEIHLIKRVNKVLKQIKSLKTGLKAKIK
ncbi:uncharacterized protein LOC128642919 [Bombina bombina]|uniref:uncharacterized protein LOC128642919 n=1 Tax=Bombina bombina TaxID=8345 RepID=UPI00235A4736|nr:uncharacterized protein LOC128642919 [Bombina bombina]XP_053551780.1 uncharacterized protein LOC128642919 [Bombina bombina]XP_053551781.1 uncharacterized protein LOC128642919 [Bombina bombina]XP_053551782.1 uncharacterized protein LOC128642919 [Bombina bombina]